MDWTNAPRLTLIRNITSLVTSEAASTRSCADAASTITAHQLLQEPGGRAGATEALRSALDGLVNAVVAAVAKGPESRRAGASLLLGTIASQCGRLRLLEHFGGWAKLLVDQLRGGGGGGGDKDVRLQALRAMQQLVVRLQQVIDLPGVRREASSSVSRMMQQAVVPLLQDEGAAGSPLQLASLDLLGAVLSTLPASLRLQSTLLDSTLARLFLAPLPSAPPAAAAAIRAAAAARLAQLPRTQGDAEAWSTLARRLLLSAHRVLDGLLLGLEPSALDPRSREVLEVDAGDGAAAAATAAFLPLRAGSKAAAAVAAAEAGAAKPGGTSGSGSVQLRLQQYHGLIDALWQLLAGPYPVAVPVPSYGLLLLVIRLLSADAPLALSNGAVPRSASGFAELTAALPALHLSAWRLLRLLLRAAGSQLLPLHGLVVRLLKDQLLRRVGLGGQEALLLVPPRLREEGYSCCVAFIESAGCGPVLQLAPELLRVFMVELYGSCGDEDGEGEGAAAGAAGYSAKKVKGGHRGKRQKTGGGDLAGFDVSASLAQAAQQPPELLSSSAADLPAQLAALQLLDVVLRVAGPVLRPADRAHLDALAAHAALTSAAAAERIGRNPSSPFAREVKELQLAANRALLTSVVSPWTHRAPFLPAALDLFQRGLNDSSPAVAAACQVACLQCEAVLHPRSSPLTGPPATATEIEPLALIRPRMWSAVGLGSSIDGVVVSLSASQQNATAQVAAPAVPVAAQDTGSLRGPAAAGIQQQGQPELVQELLLVLQRHGITAVGPSAVAVAGPAVLAEQAPPLVPGATGGMPSGLQLPPASKQIVALPGTSLEGMEVDPQLPAAPGALPLDGSAAPPLGDGVAAPGSLPLPDLPLSAASTVLLPRQDCDIPAAVAVPAEAAAAGVAGGGAAKPAPAFDAGESSADSEGSLPEIDSGSGGGQDDDGAESDMSG